MGSLLSRRLRAQWPDPPWGDWLEIGGKDVIIKFHLNHPLNGHYPQSNGKID